MCLIIGQIISKIKKRFALWQIPTFELRAMYVHHIAIVRVTMATGVNLLTTLVRLCHMAGYFHLIRHNSNSSPPNPFICEVKASTMSSDCISCR